MRSDDRCIVGLKSPAWVPGWDLPPHKAFMRAITPDKPSAADMTTLIDDLFWQVSRDVEEGASGPEAFTLLLRRLMTHLTVWTRGRATQGCTILACARGRPFAILPGVSRANVGSHRERVHTSSWGRRGCGGS